MGGGAAASPSVDSCGGGRGEWRRIFRRLVEMLRARESQVESLAADRAHLEAFARAQHEFWSAHAQLLQAHIGQLRAEETKERRVEAAKVGLLLGGKEREALCYQTLAELAENDLEDFRTCVDALTAEISEMKLKLKEAEARGELSESTKDDGHSARDIRAELRKLKQAYKTLSSKKDKEVSALLAEKDFVWNQLKTMERDYSALLKTKKIEAAQAIEAAQKLQQRVLDLQSLAQEKDDKIETLKAEAEEANVKMAILELELQERRSLAKDKDDEIEKLKGDINNLRKDITKSCRKSRCSDDPASPEKLRNFKVTASGGRVKVSGKRVSSAKQTGNRSRNGSHKEKVESGQTETSQKRKRVSRDTYGTRSSSLASGLRRCSTRLQGKDTSPMIHPVLFSPSFKVPKLKTPPPPQPQAPPPPPPR